MSAGSAAVIAKARAKYGGLLGLDEYKTLISRQMSVRSWLS